MARPSIFPQARRSRRRTQQLAARPYVVAGQCGARRPRREPAAVEAGPRVSTSTVTRRRLARLELDDFVAPSFQSSTGISRSRVVRGASAGPGRMPLRAALPLRKRPAPELERAPAHCVFDRSVKSKGFWLLHPELVMRESEAADLHRRPDLLHGEVAAFLLMVRADDAVRRGVAHVVDAAVAIGAFDAFIGERPEESAARRSGCGPSRPSSRASPRRCRRRRGRAGIPSA